MSYPTSTSGTGPSLFVVATEGDYRAQSLADALRQLGWNVTLATRPELATQAAGATAVIALLTPTTWNAPAVAAGVTSRAPRVIPVLAEPMALPNGPWTSAPFSLSSDTARQISETLRGVTNNQQQQSAAQYAPQPSRPFEPAATQLPPSQAPSPYAAPSMPYQQPTIPASNWTATPPPPPLGAAPTFSPVPARRGGGALGRVLIGVAVIVVLLGIALVKVLPAIVQTISANTNAPYTTNVPGPTCDKGGGVWSTTSPSNVTITCQSGNTLITRKGDNTLIGSVDFNGKGESYKFPQSYDVSVVGNIINGDQLVGFALGVHSTSSDDGQLLVVRQNSAWNLYDGVQTGSTLKTKKHGYLASGSKTYTINIQVRGPVVTFIVNGKTITTNVNTASNSTTSLSLGVSDPGSATQPSVSFSKFSYTPLSDSGVSNANANATATAQNTLNAQPYTASKPGQSCDTGSGQWSNPETQGDPDTKSSCAANGIQLSQNTTGTSIGAIQFYGRDGTVPNNYSISTNISFDNNAKSCAGLLTRETSNGYYTFLICTDGGWLVEQYDANSQNVSTLDSGQIAAKKSYSITASDVGSTQSLSIDNKQLSTQTDSTESNTDHVGLTISNNDTAITSNVTFSNFVFTPKS